ncbi:MAG: sigma-54 dependent transcriptional regulator [Thiohalomonadaceae bacterium]
MTHSYILVVDDEPDIRTLLKEILEDEGYEVGVAENGAEARKARRLRRPDLVLLDIWMPDVDGISLLKEWSEEAAPAPPVIMMSGHGTVETAVEATRLGAWDFIEKPLSLGKLLVTVQRALESYHLFQENQGLLKQVRPVTEPVGRSPIMIQLRERVRRIAQHEATVLIHGEPGSGKGVFARYLHHNSARSEGPFVQVGVAALLGESPAVELFGSEEDDKVHFGLVERANGGTLFLDDIGDMDEATQARLLGVMEAGSFYRAGGTEPVQVNVRFIAATRYPLESRAREGLFRTDLYYHLNVLPLNIPALREHPEDIPELLRYYVDYYVGNDQLPFRAFTVAAQNRLRNYPWPGNVRELQNLVQRLLIVGSGNEIDVDEVDAAIGVAEPPTGPVPQDDVLARAVRLPLREARDLFERRYFEHLLIQMEGNVARVAQHAGIERTHLYRKLRSLAMDPRDIKR